MTLLQAIVLWSCLTQGEGARIKLDDFEKEPSGWTFIDGAEFPGAKGSLARDTTAARGGAGSYKLHADFSGGGAYVGTWRDLASLGGKEFKELRFWFKASNATSIGVRLADGSGQCHQARVALPDAPSGTWQELVLNVRDLVGGEHWGGADDGRWHGPARGFGLNLGKDEALGKTLWIDDVEVVLGQPVEGRPTIHTAVLNPPSCRPGFGARITYRWDAEPIGADVGVFVHCIGPDGHMAFQADHAPSTPTSAWKGRVEYTKTLLVPTNAADGEYRIVAGLYDRTGRRELKTGTSVQPLKGSAYQIAVLKVDSNAPIPKLPPPTLKLDGYALTFNEEFNDLSVSRAGPGTRWIAHTPYWGDYGDARFADPTDGFPFTVDQGILRIEARKTPQGWKAGLLASVDPNGAGFSQKFGYFETRAKFPKSLGMWPAFWLCSVKGIKDRSGTNPEIDVIEHYGVMPNAMMMALHLWGPGKAHEAEGECAILPGMTDDFHTYGVMVDEQHIVWYFDGVELWRRKTPEAAKTPMYVMVNLAMGGGWPIDKAVSPSFMYVDYVRAYAKK